jgi:tyrosyl-tRNA synthetase
LIGDPTGRKEEKQILTDSVIESNVSSISAQIHRIFLSGYNFLRQNQSSPSNREVEIKLINNMEWSGGTKLIDFLVKVGKHVRVNHMLARDWY